jgi:hypothetical protein
MQKELYDPGDFHQTGPRTKLTDKGIGDPLCQDGILAKSHESGYD